MRILAAIIVTALGATTAQATEPTRFNFSGTFPKPVECAGFNVTVISSFEASAILFFDNEGAPAYVQYQFKGGAEIFRDDDPTNVLTGRRREMQRYEYSTNTLEMNGGVIKVNLPGYGPLFFDAGRVVFGDNFNVEYVHGKHHDDVLGQTDALCWYFSQ